MRRAFSYFVLLIASSCQASDHPPSNDADEGKAETSEEGGQDHPNDDAGDASDGDGVGDGGGTADAGGTGDGAESTDGRDSDGDGQDDNDAGSADGEDSGDDGGEEPSPVRFVAFGDAGEGNDDQFMVAFAIEQVCIERGCDFALYLGDNFYDDGVSSAMDTQFVDKFEMPYMDIDFPFYVALGNHDYGLLSNAWEKSQYEIDYSLSNDKWILPEAWYTWMTSNVQFFAIDTTQLMWNRNTSIQQTWLGQQLSQSNAPWKIVYGHHPYVSNGTHGNAGNYEGFPLIDPISGRVVKLFMEESVLGAADVYLSGHDHTRQWLVSTGNTEFIVSGAGSKVEPLVHRDGNATHWEDATVPGFLWVEIDGDTFTGAFYDRDANLSFERAFSK